MFKILKITTSNLFILLIRLIYFTSCLVMSYRGVDFDEKEKAILEHVFNETKIWRKEEV